MKYACSKTRADIYRAMQPRTAMPPSLTERRRAQVSAAIGRMKETIRAHGETRTALDGILSEVQGLAEQADLWADDVFASPEGAELQARYLISADSDHGFALYLNVMRPGKKIVPHNHTTWACIAAVSGTEENRLYRRIDGVGCPGPATLEQVGTVMVEPRRGIALMPEDIHAVMIPEGQTIRHLHMYGRALETLDRRVCYDLDKASCSFMGIGVQTRR
jgi:predicted metal-dependent enzyme (double-stranded beta helix superfamily)